MIYITLHLYCRNLAVILHVIKGNIGTGILAMPNAFSNSGIVVSTLDTLILAGSFTFVSLSGKSAIFILATLVSIHYSM